MTDTEVLDFLEHVGVKGMHWGVRKARDEGARKKKFTKQEKREVRAKKYEDKAANIQKQIDEAKANRYSHQGRPSRVRKLQEKKKVALSDAERKREGKLSKGQKQVAIGAGAAVAVLAAYGTYHSLDSGNARRLTEKGKAFITRNHGSPFKQNPSLADPNLTPDQLYNNVVRHINPDYGQPGTKMNCRRATFAYEMRRRGNDVEATRSVRAIGQEATGYYNATNPGVNLVPPGRTGMMTRMFRETYKPESERAFTKEFDKISKTGAFDIPSAPRNIFTHIENMPNGARGELGMMWHGGGGHSMAWENVNGKAIIFDTQNGRMYKSKEEMASVISNMSNAGLNRLDNLPMNSDFLMRWVKNV